MQEQDEISLTCCYCNGTPEAREISQLGKAHVHCPCDKCNGKATWRMTAWRHLKPGCEQPSTHATPVKRARQTLGEPECSPLESIVQYEELDFDPAHIFWFADNYNNLSQSSDVCDTGADRLSDGSTGSIDGDNETEPGDNEAGPVCSDDDEEENLKKLVQESVLRLVEMKQKMGCSIQHFEDLLQWGERFAYT